MKNGKITDYGEKDLGNGSGNQLSALWEFIDSKVKENNINCIVAENIFYDEKRGNIETFSKLSKYQGVIEFYAHNNNIELEFKSYLPTQWKRTLLNKPYATKDDILKYIKMRVDCNIESDNVADAIAIALTWNKRKNIQHR